MAISQCTEADGPDPCCCCRVGVDDGFSCARSRATPRICDAGFEKPLRSL
jgi:hypothetical protein